MYNVSKVVQDKVSFEGGGRTMHHQVLEGPLTCLGINKDCSQVVVAGRNVFKVFSIEEEEFLEKVNLRVGKNLNLNYSASDVVWNPVDDHLLASAATNGAVVIWNLNKASRSKQEQVFSDHKRTVNKVCFHANESHFLLSGARNGLMMLFDLRKKDVTSTFKGKSESVRDVQFSPYNYFHFAAAFENGNIQIWDMRNTSRWERQFTAHSGPAFSIDWHPQERHWIGTAGRDRLIKVWDMQNSSRINSIFSVQTIASVARIKWRPNRQYHIASCALLVDCGINVWDIRRPYIPFATFNEHKDVVSGIVWKHNDPHAFLSSSRDCTLYQHVFRDATRPADNANPVGVSINPRGEVAHASSDKLTANTGGRTSNYSATKLPTFFRRVPDRSEQFTVVSSSLCELEHLADGLSMDWFVESARRYKLSGRSLQDICDNNAAVATDLNRVQVAQTWKMLKLLYSTASSSGNTGSRGGLPGLGGKPDHMDQTTDRGKITTEGKQHHENKGNDSEGKEKMMGDTSTGMSEDDSDVQEVEGLPGNNLANIASGMGNSNHSDFFFGDGDIDQTAFEYDGLNNLQNGQDWSLPNEAIQFRHEIMDRTNPPDPVNQSEWPSSANESELPANIEQVDRNADRNIREEILAVPPFLSSLPSIDFTDVVVDTLRKYAEQGDVQLAVSVLIVLGDKIRPQIDETSQEQWFTSYIDLLGRFKLWTIATEVIKCSNLPAVSMLNQQSTTIHTHCSKCMKPLGRRGWLCDRCKGTIKVCGLCNLPVKGLFVWCQGCSHGGHLNHMREWLRRNRECPTGCGHLCEYT